MFLNLNHQKLDVYHAARKLNKEVYTFTKTLPADERFALVQQLRRAALSVHLNLAEGCSRKSEKERIRFLEISRGSVVEIDAALDACEDLAYCTKEHLSSLGDSIIKVFSLLSKMIPNQSPPTE
jgi:four helix bundle protein